MFPSVLIESTKNSNKDMFTFYMDNKLQKIIGDVFCPTCKNGKCVYISIIKTSSFKNCRKSRARCNVPNFPFKEPKLMLTLLGGDGTHCSAKTDESQP